MNTPEFIFKVDVDTDRGTRVGVPNLCSIFKKHRVQASFFFSLGPDNTGKQIRRVFQKNFFKKVSRTNVLGMYGFKTLLYGTLLKAPHIGQRNHKIMQDTHTQGFEVGVHCYDHFEWQDYLHDMLQEEVKEEFDKGLAEFQRILQFLPRGVAAPGWQTNEHSLQLYDDLELLYASDTRGMMPFFPAIGDQCFRTLQIPTTLPTLDELLGRPEYPDNKINDYYLNSLQTDYTNVHTIHAEIEGMSRLDMLEDLILLLKAKNTRFTTMEAFAKKILEYPELVPFCQVTQSPIDGRAGLLACQGKIV